MVVDDPAEAVRLAALGHDVVVLVAEGDAAFTGWGDGPGHIALFVERPGDPASRSLAEEMDRELHHAGT